MFARSNSFGGAMFRSMTTLSLLALAACGVPSVERVGGNTDDDTDIETEDPGNGVVPNDDNVDTLDTDTDDTTDTDDDETDNTDDGESMTFEVTLATDVHDELDGDWEFWVSLDLDGFVFPTNVVEIGDARILSGEVSGLEQGDKFLLNGTGLMSGDQFWLVENGDITHISRLEVDNVEYVIDVDSAATTSPAAGTCRIHDSSDHNLICRVGTPDEDDQEVGETSEYCLDNDGDGFGSDDSDDCDMYEPGDEPSDYVDNDDDCDDSNEDVNPDAEEVDDNVDNDCDGDVDSDDSNCEDCINGGTVIDVRVEMSSTWCSSDEWQVRFHREEDSAARYSDDELALDLVSTDDVTGEIEVEDGEILSVQAFCDSDGNGDIWNDSVTWGIMSGITDNFDEIEFDGQVYTRRLDRDDTPAAGECTLPSDVNRFDFLCKIDL